MSAIVGAIPVMRPEIGEEEARAAANAVLSGWVAQGPRVARFEAELAAKVGAEHGVAVSSCTTGLHLALVLIGVGPEHEVIVPSLSFIATANVVRQVGATPVFADVEAETLNMTAATIERVRSPRTACVILVHQAGVPADIDGVRALCDRDGIALIEDAACAIGSEYRGRPIGSHADLVAFSFHPRKVITTGEGGMLMVRDPALAQRARRLREHGMSISAAERHASDEVVIESYLETGFNYRMTDIQAAIGLVQLGKLDEIVRRRRALAARYQSLLAGVRGLRTASDPPHGLTNYQSFWVQLPSDAGVDRDDLLRRMAMDGVQARRGIMASHLEPTYANRWPTRLPVTEEVTRHTLILPLFHTMTDGEQEYVVQTLRRGIDAASS